MQVHQVDRLSYLTSDVLGDMHIVHGIFSRHGGVSPSPWAELNVGGLVGDSMERVIENRRLAFHALRRQPESIYDVWQSHSSDVVCTNSPRPANQPHLRADVILTDTPEVSLFMRFADCVPILLCDPIRRVVGLAHAGWQGTVKHAAAAAVHAMMSNYHSNPGDIHAVIGPSICVDHYQVGKEVVMQVRDSFSSDASSVLMTNHGLNQDTKYFFNLQLANQILLERCGVKSIETTGICTYCQNRDWYSHRAEKGRTGRFGVLIAIG